MELKKFLTPWNWFKKEEEQVPVHVKKGSLMTPTESPLALLHKDIDRVFENFFRGFPLSPFHQLEDISRSGLILPKVDISEGKNDYTISVEVPGIEEKDIELTVEEGTLTVRGEKQYEKEDQDKQYHRVERSYGTFQRLISLPHDVDEEKIDAKFKQGVLTITIGKILSAKMGGRKIEIKNS